MEVVHPARRWAYQVSHRGCEPMGSASDDSLLNLSTASERALTARQDADRLVREIERFLADCHATSLRMRGAAKADVEQARAMMVEARTMLARAQKLIR